MYMKLCYISESIFYIYNPHTRLLSVMCAYIFLLYRGRTLYIVLVNRVIRQTNARTLRDGAFLFMISHTLTRHTYTYTYTRTRTRIYTRTRTRTRTHVHVHVHVHARARTRTRTRTRIHVHVRTYTRTLYTRTRTRTRTRHTSRHPRDLDARPRDRARGPTVPRLRLSRVRRWAEGTHEPRRCVRFIFRSCNTLPWTWTRLPEAPHDTSTRLLITPHSIPH